MTLEEIAEKFEGMIEQHDCRGLLALIQREIPSVYPSLIRHPNLKVLQDECPRIERVIESWKWVSFDGKFCDKESFLKWAAGEPLPEHRTSKDDLHDFVRLLRSFAGDAEGRDTCWHSHHFNEVHWFGKAFTFNKTQARIVGLLWKAWENNKGSVNEKDIATAIGSNATKYRLLDSFRIEQNRKIHPAWGTMITALGGGSYALSEPSSGPV